MGNLIATINKEQQGIGIVEITKEENEIYANFKKYGVSTRCIDVKNGVVRCLLVTLNGTKCNGLRADSETCKKVASAIKSEQSKKSTEVHVCWECGRKFYHKPASDGTCGEC